RRAGGDDGMVRTLQSMADRYMAGSKVDDLAGDEERADSARPALLQQQGILGDAVDAADARTDHHARRPAILVSRRAPAGIRYGQFGGGDGIGDEVADLALFLGLKEIVRLERAIALARDRRRNLGRQVRDLEALY